MAMLAWTWGGDGGVTHTPPPPHTLGTPSPKKVRMGWALAGLCSRAWRSPFPSCVDPQIPLSPTVMSRPVSSPTHGSPWFPSSPIAPPIPYSCPHLAMGPYSSPAPQNSSGSLWLPHFRSFSCSSPCFPLLPTSPLFHSP